MNKQESKIKNIFAISPFNEHYLPSVNNNIFERIDSVTLFKDKFKTVQLQEANTLHIFVGMDSGLLANYILELPQAPDSKYVFVELDDVLSLLSIEIPTEVKDSFYIYSFEQFQQQIKQVELNLFIVKKQFNIHYSFAASANCNDNYAQLCHNVEKTIEREYFDNSTGFTQKQFFKRQLENLSENLQPAELLRNTFVGKTSIILGGGPSLDDHIEWIKKNRNDLIIISASRVVGKLAKLGISSDIVITVDPQEHSFEVNEAMMALSQDILLVSAYHTCSDIVAQWNGNLLYLGIDAPWKCLEINSNITTEGPTVTNCAVHLAAEMGFNQILLCGVDYCYSQTGKSHTTDTYAASFGPDIGTIHEWVETYNGELAETPMQLFHSIEALAETTKKWPLINFINLSKNAAKVKGVNHCQPISINLEPIPTTQRNSLKQSNFNLSSSEKSAKIIKIKNELNQAIEDMGNVIKLLKRALALCKKIENTDKNELILLSSNKLNNLEYELNTKFNNYCYLIKFYGFYEFSHFLSTKNSDSWTQKDIIEQNNSYYRAFFYIANEIYELMNCAIKRLNARVSEYKEPEKFDAFIPQWIEDNHFGRSNIWLRENPEKYQYLSEKDKEKLAHLQLEYLNLFNKKKHEGSIIPKVKNLDGAFKKLSILMQQQHIVGIQKMVQYTEPFKEQESKIFHLYNLAKSYQLYLENNLDESLKYVLLLDDTAREENELRHIIMLAIKLDSYHLAEESLKKIIQYNDAYIPQLASILALQGKPQDALSTYLDYLDKYPEDVPVLLKLGTFLKSFNEIESAKSVFNRVLNIESNNQVALRFFKKL